MFLQEMTGAKLPIVSDQQPQGPKEIILGDNAHLRKLGVAIDLAALGNEGYVIRTVGDNLVIAGGQLRGNMYGVYGFLEDHLGCRWFAPGVSRIPKSPRLAIGPIDDRQVPALEYREPLPGRLFRRRLVRPEPHELQRRPARREARRQGEGLVLVSTRSSA